MAKQRGQKKLNGFSMVDRRNLTCSLVLTLALIVAGCGGIPPLNSATISNTPASASEMANARRAVETCKQLPNGHAMQTAFESQGFVFSTFVLDPRTGDTLDTAPFFSSGDGSLVLQVSTRGCAVGLRGMTPQQSFELAQIWARHYDLATNSELGQGLSDHVVQAWQAKSYPSSSTLVAAHKTWPWDRGQWPKDEPGAAVTLQVI